MTAKRPLTHSKLSGSAGSSSRDVPVSSSGDRRGRRVSPLRLAYRLLARRAHSEEELAARLRRHGVSGAGIAATIDELKRQGYLDDAATAAQWARSWRSSKGWGPLRVRAELIRRGLDRRLAERVLAEAFPDDETEASAMQIAVRLAGKPAFAKASASGGQGPVRRLAAHLSRRGFPSDLARRVASHCCQGGDDVNIDHDD